MVTPDDIRAAYGRIRPYVRRTPLLTLPGAAEFGLDCTLSLKLEFLQKSGTFKARGAFNHLLSRAMPAAGVCAASGGNHGAAVAMAAAELGVKARIFVPSISPEAKQKRIRDFGAELLVGGPQYPEALAACERYAAESGAIPVHAYDAWETMAGQGTVGLEWEEDAAGSGGLDTVLVACGGGGLVGGIAAWFGRRVKVVAVEPEDSRALHAALAAGGPVDVPVKSVAADSLGARNVFARVHQVAAAFVDHVALVPDTAITAAQTEVWSRLRVVLEPGGAAAFAALRCGAYRPAKGERLGVLLCGANVDLGTITA